MDVDSILLLFLVTQFKIGIYAFWKLTKRLDKIEAHNKSLQKAVMVLHKEEFRDLRDSLHKINLSLDDRPPALELLDDGVRKIEEELWLNNAPGE